MDDYANYMAYTAQYCQYLMMHLLNNPLIGNAQIGLNVANHNVEVSPTAVEFSTPKTPEKPKSEEEEEEIIDVVGLIEEIQATPKRRLDTKEITERVKMELKEHGISQATFGMTLFQKNQGTISELLNKPKPWEYLSPKGQGTYLKMMEWLDSSYEEKEKMSRESALELERTRRERETSTEKKRKVYLTRDQKKVLNEEFMKNNRPSKMEIERIANKLGLGEPTINNFFINSRNMNRYLL